MLLKTTIKKLLKTTLIMFVVLSFSTIPLINKNHSNILRTNLEIEDITSIPTNSIYLLNKENLLVKVNVFLKNQNSISEIINYLTTNNSNIPAELNGYIPIKAKLLSAKVEDKIAYLDFSKELLTSSKKKNQQIISGIVYSLLEINTIENVIITIDKEQIKEYSGLLNKSIGINQIYEVNNRHDINRVVIYYLDKENKYYLPITKYLNDKREKIEIIIEELKNPKDSSLVSPLDIHTNLLSYKEESNVLFLNFNHYLLDKNQEVNGKILDMISASVFENYDVNMVMFEVNEKELEYRKRE